MANQRYALPSENLQSETHDPLAVTFRKIANRRPKGAAFRQSRASIEREVDLEEKVRETREAFQQQLTDMEASYRAQVQQAER